MNKIRNRFIENKLVYAICIMMLSISSFTVINQLNITKKAAVEKQETKEEDTDIVEDIEQNDEEVIVEEPVVQIEQEQAQVQNYEQPKQNVYVQSNDYAQSNDYVQSNNTGLTAQSGVNWHNGNKETYYNLDMSGVISNAQAMGIQGEYWVREDGVKMYGDKVIVAAQIDKVTVIDTSLGTGIVLDWCPAGTVDVAVSW